MDVLYWTPFLDMAVSVVAACQRSTRCSHLTFGVLWSRIRFTTAVVSVESWHTTKLFITSTVQGDQVPHWHCSFPAARLDNRDFLLWQPQTVVPRGDPSPCTILHYFPTLVCCRGPCWSWAMGERCSGWEREGALLSVLFGITTHSIHSNDPRGKRISRSGRRGR